MILQNEFKQNMYGTYEEDLTCLNGNIIWVIVAFARV